MRRLLAGAATLVLLAAVGILDPGPLAEARHAVGIGTAARLASASPVGEAGGYRFLQHQRGDPNAPVTYDPCQVIKVVVNLEGTADQDQALDVVLDAMAVVSAASGLRLEYAGPSTDRPHTERATWRPAGRNEPVLVAFATSQEVPQLKGDVVGVGGSTSVRHDGTSTYVTGQVTLDTGAFTTLLAEPAFLAAARAITLHEFGHLVGLAHVRDGRELMNEQTNEQLDFGPGDLRGLARLGQGRCA